jgi:L-threonylcarbamoyladenylate synthase
MLKELVHPDHFPKPGDTTSKLTEKFWPGPLTILFKKSDKVAARVTAGLDFVAVRMPSHPVAKKLIEESNLPLAAPSANKSGRPSPTLAIHVLEDLKGRIPIIIDGGPANVGVESTVVDLNRNPPLILRPGGVTFEQLRELVPSIQVYEKSVHGTELEKQPPTPGLKYTHYSPTAKVVLFEEGNNMQERVAKRIQEEKLLSKSCNIAVIQTHKSFHYDKETMGVQIYHLGDESSPDVIASGIFKALRDLDNVNANLVLVEGKCVE